MSCWLVAVPLADPLAPSSNFTNGGAVVPSETFVAVWLPPKT